MEVSVNHAKLWLEASGEGEPVVFLHGFSLDRRMWDDQYEELRQYYRVIRYDLRGFGKSTIPGDAAYSHSEDLRLLLSYLGIKKATLVGLSIGGEIALDFAFTYPETTRALVLIDTMVSGFPWSSELRNRNRLIWATGRKEGVEAARSLWLKHQFFSTLPENSPAWLCFNEMVRDYSGWHWIHHDPVCEMQPPAFACLEKLTCPILAIVGELDLPDFQQMTNVLAERCVQAQKLIVKKAGHLSNLEAPAVVNSALFDFLQNLHALKS